MRIMVNAKSGVVVASNRRGGRACSTATGNPLEDMANNNNKAMNNGGHTPTSRPPRATPIAIPDAGRRNGGSPRASPKSSPSPSSSCSSSSTGPFYAGAKFSEAPSASSLPKPPSHWTAHENKDQFQEISNQLKLLLNIKA